MHVCTHIRNIQANHNINTEKSVILQKKLNVTNTQVINVIIPLRKQNWLKSRNSTAWQFKSNIYTIKAVILCIDVSLTHHRNKHYTSSFQDKLPTVFLIEVAFTSIMMAPCTSLKDVPSALTAFHVNNKETFSTSST